MKGQTQAVTAMLISSIIVGSVATAYVWGAPLIDKRQSMAQVTTIENEVLDVYSSVVSVSQGGEGSTEVVTLDISNGRVQVNEDRDSIEIFTNLKKPPYTKGSWTKIKGKSLQNTSIGSGDFAQAGSDLPGVTLVRAAPGTGTEVVTYRVEFRNMKVTTPSGTELRKIDLQSKGKTSERGDEITLVLTNEGQSVTNNYQISTGDSFRRVESQVSVFIK